MNGLFEPLAYEIIVTDRKGQVVRRIKAPSRSYVEAWNKIRSAMAHSAPESTNYRVVKDITGTNRNIYYRYNNLYCYGNIGEVDKGIRAGKGSTPVAISDYVLEIPIDEGGGVDQLKHQLTYFTSPAVAGDTCSFITYRSLVNDSGAEIAGIREIGLYVKAGKQGDSEYSFLAVRDVLPGGVSIPDGGAITVRYTLAVTA